MHKDEAIRITSASPSQEQNIAARQKQYLWYMGIRTVCFFAAMGAAAAELNWLWPILITAAMVLPYIGVISANASEDMSDGFVLDEIDPVLPELEAGKS